MTDTHPCPGCAAPLPRSGRYPDHYCPACTARATDGAGRALACYNESLSGGFCFRLGDDPTLYACSGVLALIDGAPVTFREARFGGIVAQPLDAVTDRSRLADLRGAAPDLSTLRPLAPPRDRTAP